jgi:neurotransmitter:Na+ symporter, NSS family
MGQPVMAFLEDSFGFTRARAARAFGAALLVLALPCVLFYGAGAFTEFDFWTGTFSLVVLALAESLVFAWGFGIDRGWEEITRGADLRVPRVFRFVIRFVTPVFLLAIFAGSMIKPAGDDWGAAANTMLHGAGWTLAPDSVIGSVLHTGVADTRWFMDGTVTPLFVIDATRLLLLTTFLLIAWVVRRALAARPSAFSRGEHA